jgi:hypothetical protein
MYLEIKRDGIIGLDLLRAMRARINLETDQLEVGNDRIPLRKTTVGIPDTTERSWRKDGLSVMLEESRPEGQRRVSRRHRRSR